jgi:hypothetical protein
LIGQAYKEIREDGHLIVILAGADIVRTLKSDGFTTAEAVGELLRTNYAPR